MKEKEIIHSVLSHVQKYSRALLCDIVLFKGFCITYQTKVLLHISTIWTYDTRYEDSNTGCYLYYMGNSWTWWAEDVANTNTLLTINSLCVCLFVFVCVCVCACVCARTRVCISYIRDTSRLWKYLKPVEIISLLLTKYRYILKLIGLIIVINLTS